MSGLGREPPAGGEDGDKFGSAAAAPTTTILPAPDIARVAAALPGMGKVGRKRNGRILLLVRPKCPFVSVDRAPATSSAQPLPALVFCPVRAGAVRRSRPAQPNRACLSVAAGLGSRCGESFPLSLSVRRDQKGGGTVRSPPVAHSPKAANSASADWWLTLWLPGLGAS
jgi:hypothetical protein